MDLRLSVEALLFASREPLSVLDISLLLGADKTSVGRALRSLIAEYRKRDGSITISRVGISYRMQLKKEYADIALPVAETEFSQRELSFLGYIAANEGVLRGNLKKRFQKDFQEILTKLRKAGMVRTEKYRNTERLFTTKRFFKYFGIKPQNISRISKES